MNKITNKEAKERKQAIKIITGLVGTLEFTPTQEEAFSIAIKALSERYMGCHGCRHYDSLQTSVICYDCSRAYKDRYEE